MIFPAQLEHIFAGGLESSLLPYPPECPQAAGAALAIWVTSGPLLCRSSACARRVIRQNASISRSSRGVVELTEMPTSSTKPEARGPATMKNGYIWLSIRLEHVAVLQFGLWPRSYILFPQGARELFRLPDPHLDRADRREVQANFAQLQDGTDEQAVFALRHCHGGGIAWLFDGVIGFNPCAWRKLHVLRDDSHPFGDSGMPVCRRFGQSVIRRPYPEMQPLAKRGVKPSRYPSSALTTVVAPPGLHRAHLGRLAEPGRHIRRRRPQIRP
jgi:hypothetical protein